MQNTLRATLIVSVYKDVENLKLVLDSFKHQSTSSFDVLVSEDGNCNNVKSFLANYKASFSISHVFQEDKGWQKNKALNNAIVSAKGNYLIFIDGDCVLHKHFIKEHISAAQPTVILSGRRVKLGKQLSLQLKNTKKLSRFSSSLWWRYLLFFWDGTSFIEEGIYIHPKSILKKARAFKSAQGLKGCNFSCYKDAMLAINGFDEDYVRPAVGEDTDLGWRFDLAGYKVNSLRNIAIQYHIHHESTWTNPVENLALLAEKRKAKNFKCKNGIVKY